MSTEPKTNEPPPTADQVLDALRARFPTPRPFVELAAFDASGLPPDLAATVGADVAGMAVKVERSWLLTGPGNVRLAVTPGLTQAEVLALLDKLRGEVASRPEILSEDWTRPLPTRRGAPRLAAVKPPEGDR